MLWAGVERNTVSLNYLLRPVAGENENADDDCNGFHLRESDNSVTSCTNPADATAAVGERRFFLSTAIWKMSVPHDRENSQSFWVLKSDLCSVIVGYSSYFLYGNAIFSPSMYLQNRS